MYTEQKKKKESIHSVHIPTFDLMKVNKVNCFHFCNQFLMSLHAPKSIVFVRLRYPVGESA